MDCWHYCFLELLIIHGVNDQAKCTWICKGCWTVGPSATWKWLYTLQARWKWVGVWVEGYELGVIMSGRESARVWVPVTSTGHHQYFACKDQVIYVYKCLHQRNAYQLPLSDVVFKIPQWSMSVNHFW